MTRAGRISIVACLLLLAGCGDARAPETVATVGPAPMPAGASQAPQFVVGWMNPSVNPCDDFYEYVCGGWIASTKLPADRPMAISFEGQDHSEADIHALLDDYAAGRLDAGNPDAALLGTFYRACTDEAAIDRAGGAALAAELARIDAIADMYGLARAVAWLHLSDASPFFSLTAAKDLHGNAMVGALAQSGLGLSSRQLRWIVDDPAFYLDPAQAPALRQYRAHVATMLALAGMPRGEAAARARAIVAIETSLARGYLPNAELHDERKQDHPTDRAALARLAPHFAWDAYLAELGIPHARQFNIAWPAFVTALDGVLARTALADLKAYLAWHAIHAHAQALPAALRAEDTRFRGAVLTGATEAPPRWRTCQEDAMRLLGDAVGRAYAGRHLDAAARAEAEAALREIETELATVLGTLAWMDEPTRAAALAKLRRIGHAVGYPETWRSLAGLELDPGSYLATLHAAAQHLVRGELSSIGTIVPPASIAWRWMSPASLNAMANAPLLTMVFPAAILQPPFFVRGRGAANHALVGWVMAHELTHHFDSGGRAYDERGELRDWWSPAAAKAYDERAACLKRQYDAYEVAPGIHVDGGLTLTENIADEGAIKLAWAAWKRARTGRPRLPSIAGLDEDQQFFVAAGQTCAVAHRPALEAMARSDFHAWWKFRTIGSLQNLPAFAAAFRCAPGTPMAPVDRCALW